MQINQTSYERTSNNLKLTVQPGATSAIAASNAAGKDTPAVKDTADAYLPSTNATPNMSVVEEMKSALNTSQQKLFDMVHDILAKQGMSVTEGQGFWRTLSGGEFKVDAETQAAAKQAISEDGEWGVKKTSQRIVNFAKALTGGAQSMIETMRDAFVKGYEAATKAWGRELPEICKQTYDAVMKLFDEWAGKDSSEAEESEAAAEQTSSLPAGTTITFEYERTVTSSQSVSFTSGDRDASKLEQAGLLSDVSDPLKYDGITLNSSWCMNEKVSVTITVGGGSQSVESAQQPQVEAGKDAFVPTAQPAEPEPEEETPAIYGRNGKKVGWNNGKAYGHYRRGGKGLDVSELRDQLQDVQLSFFKPMKLNSGKNAAGRSLFVGKEEIPLHEDGTVTLGLSDGTMRRARVNQTMLDRMLGKADK